MSIQEAYDNWSSTYDVDRNLTRDLDEAVTRRVLAALRVGCILEIGSGTGKNTAFFSQIGERVCAVDFSPAMLERARQKRPSGNVALILADITQPWPLKTRCADLVAFNLVLEHIADLGFVFREAARALVPGGRLFVSELHPFRQYQGTRANFTRNQATTQIPAFVHHISDFLHAAQDASLAQKSLHEWWHEQDQDKPPRLVSFLFERSLA